MLATNQQMYQEVLSLHQAQSDIGIDWAKVFEDNSLYKQIYKQEIIVAVMEASSSEDADKRVLFVEEQKIASTYTTGVTATQQAADAADEESKFESTEDTTAAEVDVEAQKLKANWTKQFLEQHGWNYLLTSFLSKTVSDGASVTFSEQASLKDLVFLSTLLRVFLQAGFQTQESGIGHAIQLVRKSSSIADDKDYLEGGKTDQD